MVYSSKPQLKFCLQIFLLDVAAKFNLPDIDVMFSTAGMPSKDHDLLPQEQFPCAVVILAYPCCIQYS